MGELLNELKKTPRKYANKSRVQEVLDSLEEPDRSDLLKAIEDETIPASTIAYVLNERGIEITPANITKVRRGETQRVA